ncbi:LppU/SCO3897 family protein [Haloechinothrix salitolerans]|uniref:Uncharacterized protein n=1 Tax=Haloechinothrix salitolerans TaxID=926830 RepID=A0ABW2C997_9PSEU
MTNPPEDASGERKPHAPPGPPARTTSTTKTLLIMVGAVLGIAALGLAALIIYTRFFTLTGAEVGDCLTGDINKPYSIEVADCGAPDATYRVVGRVEDKTMAEFESKAGKKACAPFKDAEFVYFEGYGDDATASGAILCLSEAN